VKRALITGITGQDGSYLTELLLDKGYIVHGMIRRSSVFTSERIDHLMNNTRLKLHHGDLNDSSNVLGMIREINPDEIYHLGAQSHVGVSFDVPEYTGDVSGLGTLRMLNAVKHLNSEIRLYNASTSEMFGGLPGTQPQSESTPFHPRSHMVRPNSMRIGCQLTIGRLLIYTSQMEFYSTMSLPAGGKHLLQEKSLWGYLDNTWVIEIQSGLEILMQSVIGASRTIMLNLCG
jgi:hypothetical protein